MGHEVGQEVDSEKDVSSSSHYSWDGHEADIEKDVSSSSHYSWDGHETDNEMGVGTAKEGQSTNWILYLFLIGLCIGAGCAFGGYANKKQINLLTPEAEVELIEGRGNY